MQDLINRQAAIEAIDVLKRNYPSSCFEELCKAVDIAIKALSAQPEQPPYIAEIESEYRKAVNNPYIKKPLAKALYEVWKKHDREDAERRVTDGGLD